MSNKQYLGLVVLVVVAGAFAFYWYEWRPTKIKERCFSLVASNKDAQYANGEIDIKNFDPLYELCLKEKGL